MAAHIKTPRGRVAWLVALTMGLYGGSANAQQAPARNKAKPTPAAAAPLRIYPVQGMVSVITGAGGNITVQNGKEGTFLVDTGISAASANLVAQIQSHFKGTVLWIVNTQAHPEHVGGNPAFAIPEKAKPRNFIAARLDGSQPLNIIAHTNTVTRLSDPAEGTSLQDGEGLPNDIYFTPFKDLRFNDEAVVMYYEPAAITDGDTIVHFRASDVISTGDIFMPGRYPLIDVTRGGSVNGLIAALNHLLDLTVPGHPQQGGTLVVPGHGRLCDESDVVEYRDMMVIVRDRVQDLIDKGMTLKQVQAAAPSRDYDPEYVMPDSLVKANDFVAAIYSSLTAK